MKLKLRRDQKSGMTGKVTFILDARAELSDDENAAVKKYKMGKEIIYSKDKIPTEGLGAAIQSGAVGVMSGVSQSIMARALNLTISVNDLVQGKRIECKDILEMLAAEAQVKESCQLFKEVLENARHFGGEELIEI